MFKQMSPLLLSFLLLGAFWSSPCWGVEREEEQGPKLRGATRGNHPLRLEQALQQTSLRRILSAVTPIKYTGLGGTFHTVAYFDSHRANGSDHTCLHHNVLGWDCVSCHVHPSHDML